MEKLMVLVSSGVRRLRKMQELAKEVKGACIGTRGGRMQMLSSFSMMAVLFFES
jgi:hypothetical protein